METLPAVKSHCDTSGIMHALYKILKNVSAHSIKMITMEVSKKIIKLLTERGYSDKAIENILFWYGVNPKLDRNGDVQIKGKI